MNECPYCYAAVTPADATCPNCGRDIEKWKTGFYTRTPLATHSRAAVWVGAGIITLLILAGFARACHWL